MEKNLVTKMLSNKYEKWNKNEKWNKLKVIMNQIKLLKDKTWPLNWKGKMGKKNQFNPK